MSAQLYTKLQWLPSPPRDFRARCRAMLDSPNADGDDLARLAAFALDETQLRSLADVITAFRTQGRSLAPLAPFKLGLIGNATLEHVPAVLVGTAARHGIALECVLAHYAQVLQEASAPDSRINAARPDAVLIALDHRGLPLVPGTYRSSEAAAHVAAAIDYVATIRESIRAQCGAICMVQTLATPPETTFGSFDRIAPGTLRSLIDGYNAALVDALRDSPDVIVDVAALAETVGSANWHSPTQWNVGKFSFDARLAPLYADHVCRVIGALRGKSRRCLVLDLDNTLWGGVVGDDGLEGIVLGQGDPTGEAYLDVQRTALSLRDRGIVLAVSSKNDDAVARAAFASHPDMLLQQSDIAVFQANWDDKATNITAIADALSLGIDAMVLLDDNPAERALVREALPRVAVPELADDPALFGRTLCAAGYFEAVAFSEEDRNRAAYYQGNARRVALQAAVADVETYLASLDMQIVFQPFDALGRSRITQLINKSNQFNLTTRRYSESEVAAIESDPGCFSLQVRLKDRFGDNGVISVVVCRPGSAGVWEIDTWLMSCRVLGRRVEQAVLREILHHARLRDIDRIVGRYVPTERNRMVEAHYEKLGFRWIGTDEAGGTTWELSTGAAVDPVPMAVDRSAFELPSRI